MLVSWEWILNDEDIMLLRFSSLLFYNNHLSNYYEFILLSIYCRHYLLQEFLFIFTKSLQTYLNYFIDGKLVNRYIKIHLYVIIKLLTVIFYFAEKWCVEMVQNRCYFFPHIKLSRLFIIKTPLPFISLLRNALY